MPARPVPLASPDLASRLPHHSLPVATPLQATWLADSIPTRQMLESSATPYLQQGPRTGADHRLVKVQDTLWVVKDFASRPRWLRDTIGRWMIARELAAIRRLGDLKGVPQSAVAVDHHALAYRYVEGVPLDEIDPPQLSPVFFQRLESLTEEMHRRGIVHLALHRGSNVLVTPGEHPVILGFQTHLHLPLWLRGLLKLLAHVDFSAINELWNRHMLALLRAELKPVRRVRS